MLVICAVSPALAQQTESVLDKRIKIILKEVTLSQALEAVAAQVGCKVSYNSSKIDARRKVSVNYGEVTVQEAISRLLGGNPGKVQVSHNTIYIQMHSQGRGTVSGTITTSGARPALYVNVLVKENGKGAVTDESGFYQIKGLKEGAYSLRISSVGLSTQEKSVWVGGEGVSRQDFTLTEDASQLNEVFVTSSNFIKQRISIGKADLRALDLPQSSATVSSALIADQQISHLGEALQNVSGVSLTQQRGGVNETFSSRGYSIDIAGTSGSIFKNGVITNTQGFPETSTLESVEVLKGSAALLYGNVSGGLVVNMVTRKPKFKAGGEVSMRAGSYGLYKPMVDLYGPITRNLAFRVVGTREATRSYRDVVSTRRTFVNPSLLYQVGKKTEILLQGDYARQNLTPDNGIGSLNANRNADFIPSRSRFINVSWAYCDISQFSGSLHVNHRFNPSWKLTLIGAVQATDVDAFSSSVPNAIETDGTYARGLSRTRTSEDSRTVQLNLNGNFKTGLFGHQLLFGTEYLKLTSVSNAFNISSGGIPVTTYDTINILDMNRYIQRTDIPDADATARTISPSHRVGIYMQDMLSLTEKIKILAGLRWSYQKTVQTTIRDLSDQAVTRGAAGTVSSTAFSPKASLVVQPVKTSSFYGSYSNNFIINTGVDIYGAQLRPSIVNQFEIGSKNEMLNGKLGVNAAIYRIINNSLAQMAPTRLDGTVNSDVNVKELTGQTTSDGLEIDVNGQFSTSCYFIAGYGYNYMRYTRTTPVKGSYVEGERLINNPSHTANAAVLYTQGNGKLKGLKIGASGFYTGKRYGGLNNTFGQNPSFNRLIPLTGFATFDISVGYRIGKLSMLVKVSNIFDALNYIAHDRYSLNPIPPRQVVATLAYKFESGFGQN